MSSLITRGIGTQSGLICSRGLGYGTVVIETLKGWINHAKQVSNGMFTSSVSYRAANRRREL